MTVDKFLRERAGRLSGRLVEEGLRLVLAL